MYINIFKTVPALLITASLLVSWPVDAAPVKAYDQSAIDALQKKAGGKAKINLRESNGVPRSIELKQAKLQLQGSTPEEKVKDFFKQYGRVFGISDPDKDLSLKKSQKSIAKVTHVKQTQKYNGIPVFGAELVSSIDADGNLLSVNGNFIPGINISTNPQIPADLAENKALLKVAKEKGVDPSQLHVEANSPLNIYNDGMYLNKEGNNYLVYYVTVTNGSNIREFVLVEANSGTVLQQFSGIHEDINRKSYIQSEVDAGENLPLPAPYWVEGNPFPTADTDINNTINNSPYIYNAIKNLSLGAYLSFDGNDSTMEHVILSPIATPTVCPNAMWTGFRTNYCRDTTGLNTVSHEWFHAYTQYTANQTYIAQSGALNESYSDIFGESAEEIQRIQDNIPRLPRVDGECYAFMSGSSIVAFVKARGIFPPSTTIEEITYQAGSARFGPPATPGLVVDKELMLVNDGSANPSLGCVQTTQNLSGKIALVDRGVCNFAVKTKLAQNAGAVGVIVFNNSGGDTVAGMGGVDPTITIPALMLSQNTGILFKSSLLSNPIKADMTSKVYSGLNERWVYGEDNPAYGGGIRDMWDPTCTGRAGKVSDPEYYCDSLNDNAGVHANSSVPNHAYALLVDGGTYNGQTILPLGLDKATNLYWYAHSNLEGPSTAFVEHADALEQACDILTTAGPLPSVVNGAPTSAMTASDCEQVQKAMLATEMRTPPSQCNYGPSLKQDPPPLCEGGKIVKVADYNFKNGAQGWSTSRDVEDPQNPLEWVLTTDVPPGGNGQAFFAWDPSLDPSIKLTGVRYLDSPLIKLPNNFKSANDFIYVTFRHSFNTEPLYDGGYVSYFQKGQDGSEISYLSDINSFLYNPYNFAFTNIGTLFPTRKAFMGFDVLPSGNFPEHGQWGQSIVKLSPLSDLKLEGSGNARNFVENDNLRIRFNFVTDPYIGTDDGWYIDDVKVYMCKDSKDKGKHLGNGFSKYLNKPENQ